MEKKKFANQNGLTLLEVLMAIVILSVSLLLLLNMAMVALDANDWSNKTTLAIQAAQEKLENLRSSANSMSSGQDTVGGVSRQWTVTNVGNFLRKVDVVITWEDIRTHDHSDTLTAFIRTDSI